MKQCFGDSVNIRLCGGHFTRAHFNQLKKIKQSKCFGPGERNTHRKDFPDVDAVKCKCVKAHSKGCGCFSDAFINTSRGMLFQALVDAKNDPEALKRRIRMFPDHFQDNHDECDFHRGRKCSCGHCDGSELTCDGKQYTISQPKLTCPYHTLAYKIECHHRSEQAEQVIDPVLGKGHTNHLESANSALIRFRAKRLNLKRRHYHVSTNLGLLESNLSFMHGKKGTQYHWVPELFSELGLPHFHGMKEFYKVKSDQRAARCATRATEEYRKKKQLLNVSTGLMSRKDGKSIVPHIPT